MILQILNEEVKKSAYVTGEHLEGLLSCVKSLNIVYKKTKTKSESWTFFPNERIFPFRNLPNLFFRYANFYYEP